LKRGAQISPGANGSRMVRERAAPIQHALWFDETEHTGRIAMNPIHHLAAASLVALLAGAAGAQPSQQMDYEVTHNFDFRPAGDVVEVRGLEFRHAWLRTFYAGDAWGVESPAQDPDFDPFGTESWGAVPGGVPGAFNSGLFGSPVPCVYNDFIIPPGGINSGVCLVVDLSPSNAAACTEFFVWPYNPAGPFRIRGSVKSRGAARAATPIRGAAQAYAFSTAAVTARGGIQLANGSVQWNPVIDIESVGGGSSATAVRDPIHFVATNLVTGDVVEASLFDFDIQAAGSGHVRWDADLFETDALELDFVLGIPPQFLTPGQHGRIELRIRNGVVDTAIDDGIFAGLLPPVGTTIPLAIPLPNTFDLDYDLGLDPNVPWDVLTDLSGGGGVNPAVSATCPADLNGDGILDFFDVLAFLEAFAMGSADADFNLDDELNFFDVLAFLEAFAIGCDGGGDS